VAQLSQNSLASGIAYTKIDATFPHLSDHHIPEPDSHRMASFPELQVPELMLLSAKNSDRTPPDCRPVGDALPRVLKFLSVSADVIA
jgi:hypothetical protein